MTSPVPMPTARQAELQDRFKQYLRLRREGRPIEALKAAKALVKEEDLNQYHAAQLHGDLAEIPEVGVYHATERIKILEKLRENDDSRMVTGNLQDATEVMVHRQKIENAWVEKQSTMTLECRKAAVRNRYTAYFSYLERDQSSLGGDTPWE
ncbi:hypothetical protein F52700_3697 [Fusarium sp. NRRL 52700]|nr:hypothetical protein F52700_3697 [Fusarium sp. NRRL 52700]